MWGTNARILVFSLFLFAFIQPSYAFKLPDILKVFIVNQQPTTVAVTINDTTTNVNNSDYLGGFPQSFFNPINTTLYATLLNSSGNINGTFIYENGNRFPQLKTCGGTDKMSAFGADGTFTCSADASGTDANTLDGFDSSFFNPLNKTAYLNNVNVSVWLNATGLVISGGWVNGTNFNASNQICLSGSCKSAWDAYNATYESTYNSSYESTFNSSYLVNNTPMNATWFNNTFDINTTRLFTKAIAVLDLTNCDTIDTTANGTFICGSDDTSAYNSSYEYWTNDSLTDVYNSSYEYWINATNNLRINTSYEYWNNATNNLRINTSYEYWANDTLTNKFNSSYLINNTPANFTYLNVTFDINATRLFQNGLQVRTDSFNATYESTFNSSYLVNNSAINTTKLNVTEDINTTNMYANSAIITTLISCDTIDTSANGTLVCGSDATGSGVYNSSYEYWTNITNNLRINTSYEYWSNVTLTTMFNSSYEYWSNATNNLRINTSYEYWSNATLTNTFNSSYIANNTPVNFTYLNNTFDINATRLFTKLVAVSGLANCGSINTTSNGTLICGVNATDSQFNSSYITNSTPVNFTWLNNTFDINTTRLFSKSVSVSGLASCDVVNTTANGTLQCDTDFTVSDAGTLDTFDSTFFNPLNNTFYGAVVNLTGWMNASSLNVSGTNNVSIDAPTFFIDSTNNRVGIGTTSPSEKLDVVGNVNISGNYLGDGATVLRLDDNQNTVINPILSSGGVYLNWDRGAAIYFGNGAQAEVARMTVTGSLGLGIVDPGNYKLNVIGDINASWVNATNLNATTTVYAKTVNATSAIITGLSSCDVINTTANGTLQCDTDFGGTDATTLSGFSSAFFNPLNNTFYASILNSTNWINGTRINTTALNVSLICLKGDCRTDWQAYNITYESTFNSSYEYWTNATNNLRINTSYEYWSNATNNLRINTSYEYWTNATLTNKFNSSYIINGTPANFTYLNVTFDINTTRLFQNGLQVRTDSFNATYESTFNSSYLANNTPANFTYLNTTITYSSTVCFIANCTRNMTWNGTNLITYG